MISVLIKTTESIDFMTDKIYRFTSITPLITHRDAMVCFTALEQVFNHVYLVASATEAFLF